MKKAVSVEEQLKEARRISIKEGGTNAAMVGFGQSFITPFALALRATSFQIGFLASFVGLVGPLAQLGSTHLMERFSRKKIIITTVFLQALLWLPIILLGFMFYKGIWLSMLPILLILFYSLHIGIGAIAGPPWFSWMGDIVSEKARGRYFGKRNKVIKIVALVSMLAAGFLLDYFKTNGWILVGFTVLFSIAFLVRMVSIYYFRKQYAPKMKLKKGYYFSFFDFVRHARENNFGRFVLFKGFLYLAAFIGAPFIAVYMLEELGFSYVWFTIIVVSEVVFAIAVLPVWGKIADKYGNRFVLYVCSFFIPLSIFLWIFSPSKLYLIFVPSLIGGIFWSGFDLASVNFIYDSSKPEHRALCATYNNVIIGIGIFVGSLIGGALTKFVSLDSISVFGFENIFLFVFLVSGIMRALVAIIFLPMIKEVRKTKKPHLIGHTKQFHGFEHGMHGLSNSVMNMFDVSYVPSRSVMRVGKIFVK